MTLSCLRANAVPTLVAPSAEQQLDGRRRLAIEVQPAVRVVVVEPAILQKLHEAREAETVGL
ncbi:MAG: hypothetical protein ACI8W7_000344 [Gammaproteobacteria bacterium]|jgi:hypothetical protein